MSEPKVLHVPDGLEGERVDTVVARVLGLSRGRSADLIAAGRVRLDGTLVAKSDRALGGAMLEVDLDEEPTGPVVVARAVEDLTILHEDADLVVVDKPPGVAAHPSLGWDGPDVLGALAAAGVSITTSGAAERRGIVQRLDVGTSGLMVVAKSEHAYSVLKRAFKSRSVEKTYHALVQGHPDPFTGTIDAPIARHPGSEWRMAVVAGGRASVTHYHTLDAFVGTTLLEIGLETGRTHQIRVHLAAVKHPLVGDLVYGADPTLAQRLELHRQWLHAARLGFTHPGTGEWVEYESPYPDDLARALTLVSE